MSRTPGSGEPLRRSLAANYVGVVSTALLSIAFVPLYIRYLGIESYAMIALFAMLQGWLALLDLGLGHALIRSLARGGQAPSHPHAQRVLLRSMEVITLLIAASLALAFLLLADWLASVWLQPGTLRAVDVGNVLAALGAVACLRLLENLYRSALIGLQLQVLLNVLSVAVMAVRTLGAVGVLAWVSPTLSAFFAWQGLVSVAAVVIMGVAVYRQLPTVSRPVHPALGALRGIRRFAAGAMAIALSSLLLGHADKVLLSGWLPLEEFGFYAFAVLVGQMPLAAVGPVTQAAYPRLAQLRAAGESQRLCEAYRNAAQLITVLLGSGTVIIATFGSELLLLWTADAALVERTWLLAVLLACGTLFNGLSALPYYLQLAAGNVALTLRANLIAVAVAVPALALAVPHWGALAAAWVWLAVNACYFAVVVPLALRRHLPVPPRAWLLVDITVPLAACSVLGAGLRLLLADSDGGPVSIVAAGLASAAIAVAALLAAPRVRSALMQLLRPRFPAGTAAP